MNNANKVANNVKRVMNSDTVKFLFKHKSFVFAIIYQLFPIDIIPDALPLIGQAEDVLFVIWSVCNIVTDQKEQAPEYLHVSKEVVEGTKLLNAVGEKIKKDEMPVIEQQAVVIETTEIAEKQESTSVVLEEKTVMEAADEVKEPEKLKSNMPISFNGINFDIEG